jgi:hypothetical protein
LEFQVAGRNGRDFFATEHTEATEIYIFQTLNNTVFYFGLAEGKATTDCADYTGNFAVEKGAILGAVFWT